MAQPHLGDRHAYLVKINTSVDVASLAAAAGYRKPGRWLADLVYAHAGQYDLMFGPDAADVESLPGMTREEVGAA